MERDTTFRRRIGAALEEGPASRTRAWLRPFLAPLSSAWEANARVVSHLAWPEDRALVTVGGATLGGGGKTRLALAVTMALAELRMSVCLIGHAYGARPRRARVVGAGDAVRVVGDEALACAWRLEDVPAAEVVVGPTRQAAIDFAFGALAADVVVLDGPVQTAPRRATLALLAVDAAHPFGNDACPPLGDRRASVSALQAATDLVVPLTSPSNLELDASLVPPSASSSRSPLRLGLVTALARPQRVEAALAARGLTPLVHVELGDHARTSTRTFSRLARHAATHRLDAWLTTDKCAAALGLSPPGAGPAVHVSSRIPFFFLRPRLELPVEVRARLGEMARTGVLRAPTARDSTSLAAEPRLDRDFAGF